MEGSIFLLRLSDWDQRDKVVQRFLWVERERENA
jgi:hypothetical protein